MSAPLVSESDPRVPDLRRRLDDFYRTTNAYEAFQERSWHPNLWKFVVDEISRFQNQPCRILEIGAGRTGFAQYLRERGMTAHFTAQDVTEQNKNYLDQSADEVVIGPIKNISGSFDLIFSTFVLEHVTDPRATLQKFWELLKPGGRLFIFCPRYDAPFYLSHSADHYSAGARFVLALDLLRRRTGTLITRTPRFLIHLDPAVFVLPWSRDRDAVHWVSYLDLAIFFRNRGRVQKLHVASGSLKDAIVKNLLQVNIRVEKPSV